MKKGTKILNLHSHFFKIVAFMRKSLLIATGKNMNLYQKSLNMLLKAIEK